jgi:hypothetical protein
MSEDTLTCCMKGRVGHRDGEGLRILPARFGGNMNKFKVGNRAAVYIRDVRLTGRVTKVNKGLITVFVDGNEGALVAHYKQCRKLKTIKTKIWIHKQSWSQVSANPSGMEFCKPDYELIDPNDPVVYHEFTMVKK